ncbi:MAG: hypothetical protein H6712_02765 [Myxococcales bacterium]|nr:hypothetical protein [Myxococcales bacterium]MCB9712748.1 hypothetical protein [Myxococcales bacterium]
MAHILVYLQRTPAGLHPGSAVALCRARDIGSERGATITAVCPGDAGALDKGIAAAAGRFGADVLVFGGPKGLQTLFQQLNPVHVLVPWTEEGLAVSNELPSGPAVPRWLTTRRPAWGGADSITAVVAGTLPWHALPEALEAEYQSDVDEVPQPAWVSTVVQPDDKQPPVFGLGGTPLRWHASSAPDSDTLAALGRLGAEPATSAKDAIRPGGTVLWMSPDPVPSELVERPSSVRLVVLPGDGTGLDPSWRAADWVFPGPAVAALEAVLDSPWAPSRG